MDKSRRSSLQVSIEAIAEHHGLLDALNDQKEDFVLVLHNEPYIPLWIERYGSQLQIYHPLEGHQVNILVALRFPSYEVVEYQGMMGDYRAKYQYREVDGAMKEFVDLRFDRATRQIIDIFGRNLRGQRWHERSVIVKFEGKGKEVSDEDTSASSDS